MLASIDREWMMLIALGGLYFAWVVLPLVPALLIYRLFPNTPVTASGMFAGLKINAGGAFAAYLVVFAAVYPPLVPPTRDIIASWQKQFWTFKGSIKLVRADGSAYPHSEKILNAFKVVKPISSKFESYQATLKFEEIEGELPMVVIEHPNFGEIPIPLGTMMPKLTIHRFKKTVELHEPIEIRELSSGGGERPTPVLQTRTEQGSTEGTARPH